MTYPPQQPDPNQPAQPQWPPTRQPLGDPPTQHLPAGGHQQPGPRPHWPPTQQMPTGYQPPGQQPPPQWPPTPGPARQAAALHHAVALSSARGWRVQGISPGVATMVSGHRPNHVLHLLLTIFTCGLWAIAWIIIAVTVTEKRLTIVADLDGNITYPQVPYQPPQTAPSPYPQGAYTPPQQPKPLAVTTGGWVAIGVGALAAVVVLAVAAAGGFSSSTQLPDQSRNNNRLYDPPTPSDTGTTPASSAAPTTAPPPTTAAADTGAQAISAWLHDGGKDRLQALSNDFNRFPNVVAKSDAAAKFAAARSTCITLQQDVEAAQAYKPIPDDQAQTAWSAALASYARAATDCIAGVDTVSVDVLNRAKDEMTAGDGSIAQAAARMRELAGS